MLTTVAAIKNVPGLGNQSDDWLTQLLGAADAVIKRYCKRDLEKTTYTEFYNGTNQPELVLNQCPVYLTGLQVYYDPTGYGGQSAGGFGSGTLLTLGSHYILDLDSGGQVSNSGTIIRIGGSGVGTGFIGFAPETFYSGKLAASRVPTWPHGNRNIKVVYQAGYSPIPPDITNVCTELVARMVREIPSGATLSSESLGQYAYAVLTRPRGSGPDIGGLASTLAPYRETTVGGMR